MQGKKWAALLAAAVVTGTGFAAQPVMAADFTAGITGSADTDAEYVTAGVTTDGKTYTFGEDSSITPASTPAITLQDGMKISAKGHTISLNTTNSDAIGAPKSDYSAIIEADLLDIHAESDSAQVNGIYVSKYWKAKNAALHVVGDVSITAAGKGGTEGIRLGSSSITIDGNVSMKEKDGGYGISGDPIADGIAYMSNNGFMIQSLGGNSPIAVATVNGLLDLKVIGNGVLVNAGGSTFNGQGGTIEVGQGTQNVAYAALRAQNGTINFNVLKDENGAITGAGTNKVNISGNIALNTSATNTTDTAGKDSAINLGLNTADSTLNGVIYNGYGKDGVTVTDDWGGSLTSTGATNVWLANGAVWTNEAWGEVGDNGVYGDTVYPGVAFEGSHVTKLTGGADADHAGVIMQKDSHATTIDNYSGWTKVIYAHAEAAGQADEETSFISAGDVVIGKAAEGSGVTLITDSMGLVSEKEKNDALAALAQKLVYNDAGKNQNLTGKVALASGLTASDKEVYVGKENITFDSNNKGQMTAGGEAVPDKPVDPDQPVNPPVTPGTDKITKGDYETFVMKGIRSAATTSFHAWRDNMTDFYDASEGADEEGIFAKAYGGKTEADVKGVHETNSYWGGQVGYDKALSSGWHMGAAFDYRDGDSDYLLGGKGDDKLYSLGVYGKKTMADGSYVKVAAKAGRVENEYTVYNELRLKALKGDYKASAYGVTAEYGKTFGTGRAYVTPKVSLAWASVGSKDYTARAGRDTISIDQESYSSLVGRLGFEAGVEHARGGFYAGLAVAHEFDGDIGARYNAADGGEKHTSFDGEDTWVELVLGGRYKLSDASQLYADFARDFGGDFEHQWKLNAGLRFSF